jgi:glycosyltransferase involved in cell wall biosynthesis
MSLTNTTFSVITPTCNRDWQLERCLESVKRQTYPYWEHIIVDDGSTKPTKSIVERIYRGYDYQYIRHDERVERVISYNDGMKAVKNDWVLFLDDDDEIMPFTLEYLAEAIKKFPEFKVFNYGGLTTNKFGLDMRVRHPVQFEQKLNPKNVVSGQVVNGQFIFHKDCLKKTGLFPEARNCYILADLAKVPGYDSKTRTLGNPWGQDYLQMYRLTQHYLSKCLALYLYITHLRTTE